MMDETTEVSNKEQVVIMGRDSKTARFLAAPDLQDLAKDGGGGGGGRGCSF